MSSIQSLPTSSDENNLDNDSLEDHALFTPDLEYYTPPTRTNREEEEEEEETSPYKSRTLFSVNQARCTILPMFLPSCFMSNEIITTTTIDDIAEPPLLLTNVPSKQLNTLQKARRLIDAYHSTFVFTPTTDHHLMHDSSDSFLSSFYHQLLLDLSLRWNMNIFILDYNLARLRKCAFKCREQLTSNTFPTATFAIEELPLALEFYLQIDVDRFYMKTCSFRQAQAIQPHIFCSDEPQVRYGLTPCHQRSCPYCHPKEEEEEEIKLTAIQFHSNQIHQFINGYQAILNCPVTCETANIIYVLTCPCGQVDYIGYTSMPLRDCLAYHRNEGNRMMREFLIGGMTTNRILQGMKSDEAKRNDTMLLYQHSARCSVALQLFLDVNPNFWCLVPMKSHEHLSLSPPPPNRATLSPAETTETSLGYNKRLNALAKYLVNGIPPSPLGFTFSERQLHEQLDFFRNKKDLLQAPISTMKNIDLFQATIVAVLPENCSTILCQLVLSLFVTHAESKLNDGSEQLIYENIHRHYPFRGTWCENLIRRPSSTET